MTIACEYYVSRDDKLSHKIVCSLRVRESGPRCIAIYDIVKLYEGPIKILMKGVSVIFPKVWNYKLVFCFL